MATRGSYWSGSKHADWVRKTFASVVKPHALTLGQWKKWDNALKESHPFVFWYTEEFLNRAQDVVFWLSDKMCDFRYWVYNRCVSRPHLMDTKLKRGAYYDVDTRILHGLFETLVDFVEIEKAWMMVMWSDDNKAKYQLPWHKRVPRFLRYKQWRCPEAGVDHLRWEMSLVNEYEWLPAEERAKQSGVGEPTTQAIAAKEVYDLYTWWKTIRPNRPDPMDESGWSRHCELMREVHGDVLFVSDEDKTDEERMRGYESLTLCNKIEDVQRDEDQQMLIRLIKIRHNM